MHGTLVPCGGSIPPVPYIRAGLSPARDNRTECFLTLIFAMDAAGGLGGLIYDFPHYRCFAGFNSRQCGESPCKCRGCNEVPSRTRGSLNKTPLCPIIKGMRAIFRKLKQRVELLRNDGELAKIFLLHLLLIALHVYENYVGSVEYFWYLRAGGCGLIALLIFFLGRKGLAFGLLVYSCSLVYINNFYNYASVFFMLIAIGAYPKLRKVAPWVYLVNVVISFTMKRLGIIPFLIHVTYIFMFQTKMQYVFKVNTPDTLNLTDDEKAILRELLAGKKQKEIELFSQPTITAKLKNARERNMIETTPELLVKFAAESGIKADLTAD